MGKTLDRPVWFPGNLPPAHLDGTMIGDYGFDPLKLGSDPLDLEWLREAELQHCRWAMLGVAGILVGEVVRPEISFYSAPKRLEGTLPIAMPNLLAIEFILMHFVEIQRWMDLRNKGISAEDSTSVFSFIKSQEVGYPGGIFDPLGMSKKDLNVLKTKEIKNGRLAMISFVGFIAQEEVTGLNPLAALRIHLDSPGRILFSVIGSVLYNNLFDNL